MSDEIELKLQLSAALAKYLAQIFSEYGQSQRDFLGNTYYDTPAQFFAQHKMGLRVRKQNHEFIQTLKTDGKVVGGLHIRPEYNQALNSAEPDLTLLAQFPDLQLAQPYAALQAQIRPIFSTDFERQSWQLTWKNSAFEVALDQGEIKAGEKSEPICELEIELKAGELQDLLDFVRQLPWQTGAFLSSASKAKRGYQLANDIKIQASDWLEKWRKLLDLLNSDQKTSEKITALFSYEQQLVEETLNLGASAFSGDFVKTVERIGAFFNLYHYYSDSLKLFSQLMADEQLLAELAESNQQCFAQIRQIIRTHSENKDNAQALAQLMAMLVSPAYVCRMLNLIQVGGN